MDVVNLSQGPDAEGACPLILYSVVHSVLDSLMKCRGLPPAGRRTEGAEGSIPGGSEGAVKPCYKLNGAAGFCYDFYNAYVADASQLRRASPEGHRAPKPDEQCIKDSLLDIIATSAGFGSIGRTRPWHQ